MTITNVGDHEGRHHNGRDEVDSSSPTATPASASCTGARASARRSKSTYHRHDDVPRDGHAVLAGEGGGGDEGSGVNRALVQGEHGVGASSTRRSLQPEHL